MDRILRTSGPLLSLIAPNEANTVRLQVKQICDHYANLRKLIKTRAIKAEANLKQSDEASLCISFVLCCTSSSISTIHSEEKNISNIVCITYALE